MVGSPRCVGAGKFQLIEEMGMEKVEKLAALSAELRRLCRENNTCRAAIYWLPGNRPSALLLRADDRRVTVGLLQWPVYPQDGKPRTIFVADLEKVREPFIGVAEELVKAVMDEAADIVNTFFLPPEVREARKSWRGYEVSPAIQVAHCRVAVGDIIV